MLRLKFIPKVCTGDDSQQIMQISENLKTKLHPWKRKQERSQKPAVTSRADICADRILSILLNLLY